jgi:putative peptide zinc metalloprotease protein
VVMVGFGGTPPGVARADEGGGANSAIAINTKDGSSLFKVAFAIRHVMNGVVDQQNAAVAYASCTDCTTVAIAIEIVLVESNASVVTPENVAIAFNELCQLCVTVADALQFVTSTGGPVHFDQEGERILDEIRHELHDLKKEELTLAELQARIEDIRAKIRDVLAHHLVPSGKPEPPREQSEPPETTTTTPVTPATTESTPTSTTTTTESTTTQATTTEVTTTTGP